MKTFTLELPSKTVVTMQEMSLRDADLITTSTRKNILPAFFNLLDSCTVSVEESPVYDTENFKWINAYEGDWFFALLNLRSQSLGDDYSFQVPCENCKTKISHNISISDLNRVNIPEGVLKAIQGGKNAVDVNFNNDVITIRLITGKIQIKLDRSNKLRGDNTASFITQLNNRIIAINGNNNREVIQEYINNLSFREGQELLKIMDKNIEFGVDTNIPIECEECGFEFTVPLPLRQNFFQI